MSIEYHYNYEIKKVIFLENDVISDSYLHRNCKLGYWCDYIKSFPTLEGRLLIISNIYLNQVSDDQIVNGEQSQARNAIVKQIVNDENQ